MKNLNMYPLPTALVGEPTVTTNKILAQNNKNYVKDQLEIEIENSTKHNEKLIFNKDGKLYHDASNICYICNET